MLQQHIVRTVIVESDKTFRKALTSILKKRGHEIYACSKPDFCPVYLDIECPCPQQHTCSHLFLIDMNKPKSTGLEFIENQKRNGCRVQHIAVMSASWLEDEVDCLKKLGCKILYKPFKMNELTAWLDECEHEITSRYKLSDLQSLHFR